MQTVSAVEERENVEQQSVCDFSYRRWAGLTEGMFVNEFDKAM
jgi:hypothetical protein